MTAPSLKGLKTKILIQQDSLRSFLIQLETKKKKVTLDEKLALNAKMKRLLELREELKDFGKSIPIVQMEIEIWENQPYLRGISERKNYTVSYVSVTEDEARELVEMHFPTAKILSTKIILTGTKILKK